MDNKNISAAIIAGGAGKRMGGVVKAKIIIKGETVISRMLKVLEPVFSEIIIVTNYPDEFSGFGSCRIVGDIFIDKGPLGGIHSAIVNASAEAVFVLAGDMPFISRELIEKQAAAFSKESEALVASIGNEIEPLHSVYSVSLRGELEKLLSERPNIAVRHFLSGIRKSYFQVPDTASNRIAFTNINTPEDLI